MKQKDLNVNSGITVLQGGEDVKVKFDGHHQSHYGTDFLEWNFVEPVQVMVTQYQNI